MTARRAMVDTAAPVSLTRQCELLRISRSSCYYEPVGDNAEDLALMRRIDELYLARPFLGSRRLSHALRLQGIMANRKRVQRLMRLMGLEAVYPKPRTSEAAPEHTKYPYLLRYRTIDRPNQVFAADITYIPMRHGFLYLVAVMDWYSRRVVAWRLSNTMDSGFCVAAVADAIAAFGAPTIFNTDQGSQFTDDAFTAPLLAQGVKVSMDGKGRWMDNVFIERLWRSLKHEEVYLHAYDSISEARARIGAYIDYYNNERPHQALGYQTPDAFYRSQKVEDIARLPDVTPRPSTKATAISCQ